jgi:hypothetical protein
MIEEILFWVAAAPIILFPIFYAIGSRRTWWRDAVGRHEMALSVAFFLLASLGILRRWLGEDYSGRAEITFAALVAIGAVMWWRLGILVQVQVQARPHKRKETKP